MNNFDSMRSVRKRNGFRTPQSPLRRKCQKFNLGNLWRCLVIMLLMGIFASSGAQAMDEDPSDPDEKGVWVLTEKNYNASYTPRHFVVNGIATDIIIEEDLTIADNFVFYVYKRLWPAWLSHPEHIETHIEGRIWTEPPHILHPGEEIKTTLRCDVMVSSDDAEQPCDFGNVKMDFFVVSCYDSYDVQQYYYPADPLFRGDCLTEFDENDVPAHSSSEWIWKVPELNYVRSWYGECDTNENLYLVIRFDGYPLSHLVYYYNYTYRTEGWQEETTPEGRKDSIPKTAPQICDKLKVSIEEAERQGNTCLLRTRVVEACSGDEEGLGGASLEYKIWDADNKDYRYLQRSADLQGEHLLEVPVGTWIVEVHASKEGYNEGWTSIYNCCGQEQPQGTMVFDTWNNGTVQNGPICSPFFTLSKPHMITYIDTYHWNYGRGAPGGTISLRKDDGTLYGPWAVMTMVEEVKVPKGYWIAYPNEVIPAGSYSVEDSDPATWSQNSESPCGFTRVEGYATSH